MINFNYDLEIKYKTLAVQIEARARFNTDDYGADSDGKGGRRVVFMDSFNLKILDKRGKNITGKVRKKYEDELNKIRQEAKYRLWKQYYGE